MQPSPFWIPQERTLSIDPCPQGFGFTVLEGRQRLVDWGVAYVWAKSDKEWLARVETLIDKYEPALVAFEEVAGSRRGRRGRRLLRMLEAYVRRRGMRAQPVSRDTVRHHFASSGTTKHEIATAVARIFPELETELPARRAAWSSEAARMNVFDAAALGLVVTQ